MHLNIKLNTNHKLYAITYKPNKIGTEAINPFFNWIANNNETGIYLFYYSNFFKQFENYQLLLVPLIPLVLSKHKINTKSSPHNSTAQFPNHTPHL